KLELYQTKVTNAELKEIISLQANVMREHARVMLALINPHQNKFVELKPLSEYMRPNFIAERQGTNGVDKWIALEGQTTAQSMSNDNYTSALMMKSQHVKAIHVQMALQQLAIQDKYEELIHNMGWAFTPHASVRAQINTYQHYQHFFGVK